MKIDLNFEIICQDALEMLSQIRQQLNSSIHSRSWMDGTTKVKAVAKLDHMFLEVGDLCVSERVCERESVCVFEGEKEYV